MPTHTTPSGSICLLAGLGNPGPRYANTRHNIGFMAVEALRARLEQKFPHCLEMLSKPKGCYELWKAQVFAKTWLLVKPLTYMNLSGEAVAPLANFYKIPITDILAVHDELDLPLGRLRFKRGGGLAGHNGLRSLEACLGSRDFLRLRLGIGKPSQADVVNYVTSSFFPPEVPVLEKVLDAAANALLLFMEHGLSQSMQEANAINLAPAAEKAEPDPAAAKAGEKFDPTL